MKKVINITIGRVVFFIEDDAYEKLRSYIDSIRKHFGSTEEGVEIQEDIESSIADKFGSKIKDSEAVTTSHVDDVIKEMGTIEELAGFEENAEEAGFEDVLKRKRLYRDTDDRIIAGVASGIGRYFDIDPIIPRIMFIVLTFANGLGAILYIILWFVVSKATTTTQKLEMRGEAVTLTKVSEYVEEKIEKVKESSKKKDGKENKLHKFLKAIGSGLERIVGIIPSLFRIIFGTIFTVAAFLGVMALTIAAFSAPIALPTIDSPVAETISSILFDPNISEPIILAIYFVVFVPLLVLLMGGIGLLKKKSVFTTLTSVVLVVVWTYSLVTIINFGSNNAPMIREEIEQLNIQLEDKSIEYEINTIDLLIEEIDREVDLIDISIN